MARQKAFDREVALEKAMNQFWQKGYTATSMQDLVQCMGINRGSLYDTFGDKHSLFLAAIALYNQRIVQEAITPLETPHAAKSAIIAHFNWVVEQAASDPHRQGCLLTNTGVELAPHDSNIATQVQRAIQRIEAAYRHALQNAQTQGEIPPDKDIDHLATFLVSQLQGIRVMSKLNPHRDHLQPIAQTALTVLD